MAYSTFCDESVTEEQTSGCFSEISIKEEKIIPYLPTCTTAGRENLNVPDSSDMYRINIKQEKNEQETIKQVINEQNTVIHNTAPEELHPLVGVGKEFPIKQEKIEISNSEQNENEFVSSEDENDSAHDTLSWKRTNTDASSSTMRTYCNKTKDASIPKSSAKSVPQNMQVGSIEIRPIPQGQDSEEEDDPDTNNSEDYREGDPLDIRESRSTQDFAKTEIPNCDDLLYCIDCKCAWEGDCPEHGPLIIVEDTPVLTVVSEHHAERTAPSIVKIDKMKGVTAAEVIHKRTRFGPFLGKFTTINTINRFTRPISKYGKIDHCLDASDPSRSNWMRYVESTDEDSEINLDAYQYKGQIYFRSVRQISPGEVLIVTRETSKGGLADLQVDRSSQNSATKASKDKSFLCKECNKSFPTKSRLYLHSRTHTGEKPYMCSECGKQFTSSGNLSHHMRGHSGERPFQCSECSRRFSRRQILEVHQRTHTGEKPLVCSFCDQRFAQHASLIAHKRTHTKEKPYVCIRCGQRFSHKSHLNDHERTHTGDKPYACALCDKRYSAKGDLNKHVKRHTGEKPYECTHCDQRFYSKQLLNRHLQRHTGEKRFECANCGQKFTAKCSLKRHIFLIHSGESRMILDGDKPFVCTNCPYRCFSQSDLSIHLRTHNSEKPLACG